MEARSVKTVEDAKHIVNLRGIKHIKVGVFDIDGVMRGKYMSKEKFFSALDKGFGFCDVVLGWDSNDQLYDNTSYTGWHTAYPDAAVRLIPESCREIPFEPDTLLFLCEFDGAASEICPRSTLMRVLKKAKDLGFSVNAALEYEFFLFNETPKSIRDKGYRDLEPFTPGNFGYSVLRGSVHSDLYAKILELSEAMDFPIEGLHTETGPGVLEAALAVDAAHCAADKAALFKTFIKVLAQRNDLMATFMAKWSGDYPGQSGHIHLSLNHAQDGSSAFFDADSEHGMSNIQRHFIAGQQLLMPEFLSMIAPTVNSYTRLVPGFWAPTDATWGIENRTTALRVIPGNARSQRVEYRLGSADGNPYLALAAALASGLHGVEQRLEPAPMVNGNAYEQKHPDNLSLPSTLWEATQKFKSSSVAKELFGEAFVNHYAATREWEEREFRKHVSDWELARYFEIT
jgi:glutamine synthetase